MFLNLLKAWDFAKELKLVDVAHEFINIWQWWNEHDSGARQWRMLSSSGGLRTGLSPKTASYKLSFFDHIITADSTSAVVTITLPTAIGCLGQQYIVKRINAGANLVKIVPNGAETIDGGAAYNLGAQYHSVCVVSNGANWLILF